MDFSLATFALIVVVSLSENFVSSAPVDDLPENWQDLIGDDVLHQTKSKNHTGETLFEGDIMGIDRTGSDDPNAMAKINHNAVLEKRKLWPNKQVPYHFENGFSVKQRKLIRAALKDIMRKTCISFVPRTDQTDYIVFMYSENDGCKSYIGHIGGSQGVHYQEGCLSEFGEVQHEVMHALGFYHEQSRTDRDDFVSIVWSNIPREMRDQFQKYQSNLLGLPYDYDSIMHYGWNDFADNEKRPTIVPKKKASIGNRKILSQTDVQKINILYKCEGVTELSAVETTPAPRHTHRRTKPVQQPPSGQNWFSRHYRPYFPGRVRW